MRNTVCRVEYKSGDGGAQEGGGLSPDALLSALDGEQLGVLRRVGLEWGRVAGDPQAWRRALPVDPDLGRYPAPSEILPVRLGRFVRVAAVGGRPLAVEATNEDTRTSRLGRVGSRVRHVLLGAPLRSTAIAHERMRKLVALPVLSADALSSVA